MKRNLVVSFKSSSASALEVEIYKHCDQNNCNPISISAFWAAGIYVAFVVVEERRESE